MFLIRKGEKPRPVCVACHRADKPAARQVYERHVCIACVEKLKRGEGLMIQPTRRAM